MQNKLSLKWTGISCCHKVCKRGVRQICKKGCFSRCFWRQDGSSHHFLFIAGENWWPIFLKGRRQEVRSWQISVLFSFPSWQQHKGFFVSDRFAKGQLITWFFIRTARVISKTYFFSSWASKGSLHRETYGSIWSHHKGKREAGEQRVLVSTFWVCFYFR